MGLRNYKKIVATSAFAAVAGFAFNAQAAVDLDNDSYVPPKFATELDISTSGTDLTNAAGRLNINVDSGMSITGSAVFYARFQLTGATFKTNPTVGVNDSSGSGSGVSALQANYAGKSYIIMSAAPTNDSGPSVRSNDSLLVYPTTITVTGESDVTVSYALYETLTAAVNQTSGLASASNTLLSFAAGHSLATDDIATLQTNETRHYIDVTQGSTYFGPQAGDTAMETTTYLGDVDYLNTTGNQFIADGATDYAIATHMTNYDAVITGDFSARATSNSVFFDTAGNNCDAVGDAADTVTATTATWDNKTGEIADVDTACYTVNGTTLIPASSYSLTITPANASGYDAAAKTLALEDLQKNGSTAEVNLMMTPGGAYSNYLRVVNTSSVAGDIYFVVYKDDGTASSQFQLTDITGQTSDELAAYASTSLISVANLYTASGLTATTGKVRVEVTGEFSGINAQSIILSKDGNSFATVSDYGTQN